MERNSEHRERGRVRIAFDDKTFRYWNTKTNGWEVEAVNGHFFRGMGRIIAGFFKNRAANKKYASALAQTVNFFVRKNLVFKSNAALA